MRMRSLIASLSCAVLLTAVAFAGETARPARSVTVLGAGSLWRKHHTFFPPRVTVAAAKKMGIPTDRASRAAALARRIRSGFTTPPPPAGWTRPEFDDAAWLQWPGVDLFTGDSRMSARAPLVYARGTDRFVSEVGLVSSRGRFVVKDPAKVKRLTLSVTHRGGFVAYLNGVEVARASLPKGKIDPATAARPYGLDAFVAPGKAGKRKPLHWWNNKSKAFMRQWQLRERGFGPVEIRVGLLRRGLNVLALELHRTDYPVESAKTRAGLCFATLGLSELFLTADTPAENVITPSERPAGVQVWNRETWEAVYTTSYGNAAEPLRPIRIAAARNGTFSGKVAVGSTSPIEGLTATASGLKTADGKAEIRLDRIQVRYGTLNPTHRGGRFSRSNGIGGQRFDGLLDTPPQKIDLRKTGKVGGARAVLRKALGLPIQPRDAAVLPIWITVHVPKDAAAGQYKGTLAISAKNVEPIVVPVEMSVADWTLPDVKDYTSLIFIYESPESLATYYNVAMWSEEHWGLIDKSLRLMGGIGNIGLIFPFTAESCHGNPETMVYWSKQADGTYKHDWTNFDRYLDTAMKYHDRARIRVVAINVWGNEVRPSRTTRKMHGALVTARDPKTGKRLNFKVPEYGTAACEAFWRPVLRSIKKRLERRGLGGKLMLGVGNDSSPPSSHVAMFRRILPGAAWFRESHYDRRAFRYHPKDRRKTVPVGCNSIVWGGAIPDPKRRRLYGWRHNPKHLVLNFNRPGASSLTLLGFPPPWSYRMWMESTLAGGRNGNGRVGGDYFKLGINLHKRWKGHRVRSEAGGGSRGTLFGSYPYSGVGQTGLGNNTTDLFAPGPDGPITTARFENAREGNQEAEARIFIEKALRGKALPAALAVKFQGLLDERTNALRMWQLHRSIGSANWREKTRRLFAAAAEVAQALKK